jgi:large subunit ribosomal protein L24
MTTRMKLNLKKGDEIKVMAGKDKGKTGKILEVDPKSGRIVAEGVNIHTRFARPTSTSRRQSNKGQRLEVAAPLNISKVMLICPNCGKTTRVGREVTDSGTNRKCKKCGKTFN